MKALIRLIIVMLAVVGASALVAGAWLMRGGINSKQQPGAVETALARRLRAAAIPTSARRTANPVRATPEVLEAGMAHFANHCASCHGNDGGAETDMARGLYPKVPDMRLAATQSLSDGELFYIIENGVKLTGMPAWATGTTEGEEASWVLVHFIRHLPKITDAELETMKGMNPKSSDEWREEEAARRFLEGGSDPAPAPIAPPHKHGGQQQ
jgi:mono/diheme cytochrome c family protein